MRTLCSLFYVGGSFSQLSLLSQLSFLLEFKLTEICNLLVFSLLFSIFGPHLSCETKSQVQRSPAILDLSYLWDGRSGVSLVDCPQ